jgi:hypothetical protein
VHEPPHGGRRSSRVRTRNEASFKSIARDKTTIGRIASANIRFRDYMSRGTRANV